MGPPSCVLSKIRLLSRNNCNSKSSRDFCCGTEACTEAETESGAQVTVVMVSAHRDGAHLPVRCVNRAIWGRTGRCVVKVFDEQCHRGGATPGPFRSTLSVLNSV